MIKQLESVSALNLVFVNASDGFEISSASSSRALPVLRFERPAV